MELLIELPAPAVKVPGTVTSETPVETLFVALMVLQGRFAVTVLRSAAGPPVASIVPTPAPTAIWKPADPV